MIGHCQHCDPERLDCHWSVESGWVHVSKTSQKWHARWVDGACPMCAEAERIAAECDARYEPDALLGFDAGYAEALDYIADFARGEA